MTFVYPHAAISDCYCAVEGCWLQHGHDERADLSRHFRMLAEAVLEGFGNQRAVGRLLNERLCGGGVELGHAGGGLGDDWVGLAR